MRLPDEDMTLEEFLLCDASGAVNRQTRMLAVQSCVHALAAVAQRDDAMLRSAMKSITLMPYFALFEYPRSSEQLFAWTFQVQFAEKIPWPSSSSSSSSLGVVSERRQSLIRERNSMDEELYKFALEEFQRRILQCSTCDASIS